jgi:hypothetical protein
MRKIIRRAKVLYQGMAGESITEVEVFTKGEYDSQRVSKKLSQLPPDPASLGDIAKKNGVRKISYPDPYVGDIVTIAYEDLGDIDFDKSYLTIRTLFIPDQNRETLLKQGVVPS